MLGEITSLITAFSWATTSVIFTEASRKVGSATVNMTRLVFALFLLSVTVFILDLPMNMTSSQWFYLSLSGFIGLTFGDSFLYMAYKNIGPRLGMLLLALAPPFSAVIAYFFLNEKINLTGIIGIMITVGGIATVVLQKSDSFGNKYKIDKKGILFGVLAAIGQAVGLIFSKMAYGEGPLNSFSASLVRIFIGTILLLPIIHKFKDYQNPLSLIKTNRKYLYIILSGAFLGPYIGITLSLYSVSLTDVGVASAIMATTPVILLPIVKYYYKETLSKISIWGALIAVGGVILIFLR